MDHVLGLVRTLRDGDLKKPTIEARDAGRVQHILIFCNTEKQADRYEDVGMYADRLDRDGGHLE